MRIALTLLAGVAALGTISTAHATDLYGEVSDDVINPPALARQMGWYMRIDGGYSVNRDAGFHEAGYGSLGSASLDNTGVLGGGIGMYFGRNFRIDFTGDYRFESDASGNSIALDVPGTRNFGLDSTVLLANIYYDFDVGSRWRPYLGFGLGAVHHGTSSGTIAGGGSVDSGSKWNFAGALMAGVSLNFGARSMPGGSAKDPVIYQEARGPFNLDIGYRFLMLGDAETGAVRDSGGVVAYNSIKVEDITAHEFRVGLRVELR